MNSKLNSGCDIYLEWKVFKKLYFIFLDCIRKLIDTTFGCFGCFLYVLYLNSYCKSNYIMYTYSYIWCNFETITSNQQANRNIVSCKLGLRRIFFTSTVFLKRKANVNNWRRNYSPLNLIYYSCKENCSTLRRSRV